MKSSPVLPIGVADVYGPAGLLLNCPQPDVGSNASLSLGATILQIPLAFGILISQAGEGNWRPMRRQLGERLSASCWWWTFSRRECC